MGLLWKTRFTFATGLVREWCGLFAGWYTNEQGRQCYQSSGPFGIGSCHILLGREVEQKGGWQLFKATGLRKTRNMSPGFYWGRKVQQLSQLIRSTEELWQVNSFSPIYWKRSSISNTGDVLGELVKWLNRWFHPLLNGVYILASNQVYLNIY